MRFIVSGQLRSGKNNMGINPRTGRHYPKKEWAAWRDGVVAQLMPQRRGTIISTPVKAIINYWRSDGRRRDVPGMMDALWHCLERAFIVKDDALISSVEWNEMGI